MRKPFITICLLSLAAAGCGGSSGGPMTKDQGEDQALTQIGELCRHYQFMKKKGPDKLTDLAPVKTQAASGYEALANGKAVLLYGATLPSISEDAGEGPGDEVLAYMAEVPQSGGKVLMLNRTVKTMSADDFKAAKKAGKEVPLPPPPGKKK